MKITDELGLLTLSSTNSGKDHVNHNNQCKHHCHGHRHQGAEQCEHHLEREPSRQSGAKLVKGFHSIRQLGGF